MTSRNFTGCGRLGLAALHIGRWALLSALAAGVAHASTSDPLANVGAKTPFNRSTALDLAQYCSGTDQLDDTSCIGRWLSDGRAQGKHLYVSPGTYIYSNSRTLFNGVQIQCADPKTTVFRNAGQSGSFLSMSSNRGVTDHPYQDIRIENCGFDLNGTTANFASVIAIGGDASSPATMARNITIRGNRIFDSTQPGSMYVERDRQRQYILILGAQDVLIEGNQLSEGGRIKAGRPGNRIVIRNNTLHNVNDNGITVVNLGTHRSTHFLIENNTIANAIASGIFFGSDGEKQGTPEQLVEDVVIRNNRISGFQSSCISGTLPNHARRISIEGNHCHKTGVLPGKDERYDKAVGIGRASNSTLPIEDLTIRNNTVRNDRPSGYEYGGIFVKGAQANLCVVGNTFHVGGSRAIFFHSSSSHAGSRHGIARVHGNVLNGATIRNSGTLNIDTSPSMEGCYVVASAPGNTQPPAPAPQPSPSSATSPGTSHTHHAAPSTSTSTSTTSSNTGSAQTYHRVLSNVTINGDVVVPDGETWLIGPNVQVRGNVRTHSGTIAMRPGSSLKFLGADPAKYVGGGMHFTSGRHENDIGLWIGAGHGARGRLDIQCTPKAGWNRTGTDPTWRSTDEYWIAPSAPGDYTTRRWSPGQPIPQADPRVPRTEVLNVTRDCVIEGPGHIHIHSTVAQRIEYVQLRRMGVQIAGMQDSGRYALHFHHMGEGARGTIVRGVAAIDSLNRVYVPHESHGISFIDNVAVNSFGEPFWWDIGDRSNDILIDRLAVSGVRHPPVVDPKARRVGAITLGGGKGSILRNSVVAGASQHDGQGIQWPDGADRNGTVEWKVSDVLVHNIGGTAMLFWPRSRESEVHEVHRFVAYNIANHPNNNRIKSGLRKSAYDTNNVQVYDALILGVPVTHRTGSVAGERRQMMKRFTIENPDGPAMMFVHSRNALGFTEYQDCRLVGKPKVRVTTVEPKNPGRPHRIRFRDCGVRPDDIVFDSSINPALVGSVYEIWEGGRHRWTVSVSASRQKVVTTH